jgi:hypothetical protein
MTLSATCSIRGARARLSIVTADEELARLEARKLRLEEDRRQLPWWLASAILVVPAFFAWGFEGALFVLLCVLNMVGTAAYLVRVARKRVERELALAHGRRDPSRVDGDP